MLGVSQQEFPEKKMAMKVIPIRASSMADLTECPARWEATQVQGLKTPARVSTWLGTSLHKTLEVYDKAKLATGRPIEVSDAQSLFTDTLWNPNEEVGGEEAEYKKAEKNGLELVRKYAELIAPNRTYVAVEVTCPKMDVIVEGVVIRLSGTVDRIKVTPEKRYGISDVKSGANVVSADETVDVDPYRAQIGVYEILAQAVTGQEMTEPGEIIGLGANGKARVATGEVRNAAEMLVGTQEAPGLLQYAARIVKHELYFGNPKSILCSEAYCPIHGRCRFRGK
jgi:hypothetical protein